LHGFPFRETPAARPCRAVELTYQFRRGDCDLTCDVGAHRGELLVGLVLDEIRTGA
jgi:hypothetical protein